MPQEEKPDKVAYVPGIEDYRKAVRAAHRAKLDAAKAETLRRQLAVELVVRGLASPFDIQTVDDEAY
jgi:uncharacterized protein YciI